MIKLFLLLVVIVIDPVIHGIMSEFGSPKAGGCVTIILPYFSYCHLAAHVDSFWHKPDIEEWGLSELRVLFGSGSHRRLSAATVSDWLAGWSKRLVQMDWRREPP